MWVIAILLRSIPLTDLRPTALNSKFLGSTFAMQLLSYLPHLFFLLKLPFVQQQLHLFDEWYLT